MPQAMQRVVHPRGGEQRQGQRLAAARLPGTVGNAIVHGGQIRQVENIAHQLAPLGAELALHMVVFCKGEVNRDGLVADADFQLDAMVALQQRELLEVIAAIQVWPRQRGFVTARARHKAVAQVCPFVLFRAQHGLCVNPNKGIAGPHPIGEDLARHKALHGLAQVIDALLVQRLRMCQSLGGVAEAGWRNERRKKWHALLCNGPVTSHVARVNACA